MSGTPHDEVHRRLRARVGEMVTAADPGVLAAPTEPCPEWSALDVLAHLVGVAGDVTTGKIEGAGTDPWTQAQVDARKDRTAAELIAEWDETGPAIEQLMTQLPPAITGQIIFDATTHEHDLRHALGRVGGHDDESVAIACGWIVAGLGRNLAEAGAALRVVTEAGEQVIGTGEPVATVRTSQFELLRAITGRRSPAQVASFGWEGEPRPDLLGTGVPFTPRATDLVE